MSNKVFSTTFEISMRILLMLSFTKNRGFTLDSIVTCDFIANYSKEFGLAVSNLHGDNEFSFSEFSTRRSLAKYAIKQLVLDGMVMVSYSKDGFLYSISELGQAFCSTLTSDYANEYRVYSKKAIAYMGSRKENELLNLISRQAYKSMRKD